MTPLELDAASAVWMFASRRTLAPLFDNGARPVNLAFVDATDFTYVSIEGRARPTDDSGAKTRTLDLGGAPLVPGRRRGPGDLTLLKVTPQRAEVWDAPDSSAVRSLAASVAAAKPVGLGDHEVIMPPTAHP